VLNSNLILHILDFPHLPTIKNPFDLHDQPPRKPTKRLTPELTNQMRDKEAHRGDRRVYGRGRELIKETGAHEALHPEICFFFVLEGKHT
jgi:hypothetical protein